MRSILIFLLLPFGALAQQDFDYALFTNHSKSSLFIDKDSNLVALFSQRRIVKEGSKLLIIPCVNTGNTNEYKILFQGFSYRNDPKLAGRSVAPEQESFEYSTEDLKYTISIWPTIPLVRIRSVESPEVFTLFY